MKTGYRTRQMLVAPDPRCAATNDLIGVIQIINSRSGQPFRPVMEEGVVQLAETLAIAFQQRQRPTTMPLRSKYEALVANAVISADELELAQRSARRKNLDIETVLIDEFQVKPATRRRARRLLRRARTSRSSPTASGPPDLLRNMSREFSRPPVVPLGENQEGCSSCPSTPSRSRRRGWS